MFKKIHFPVWTLLLIGLLTASSLTAKTDDPVLRVKIDAGSITSKKGVLDEAGAIKFLRAAFDQGLLTKGANTFPNPDCLKARDISAQGGAKTLALFVILLSQACDEGKKSSADDYKVAFILKEMQDKQEPGNLDMVKNDRELRKLDMNKPREEGMPAISFHHELISYDGKGGPHNFALLYAAPGKELRAYVTQLAQMRRDKKAGKDYDKRAEELKFAFYQTGKALAKMQNLFMEPKGKIFGDTLAHSDLHDRNVFFDGKLVTLIDNESFVHSIREKKPVWIDLLRLLNPIYNPKPDKHHPKEFKPAEWVELSVTPLFQGYVDGSPKEKKNDVKAALKKMFLKDSPATDKIKEQYGDKHLKEVRDTYLEPSLNAVH